MELRLFNWCKMQAGLPFLTAVAVAVCTVVPANAMPAVPSLRDSQELPSTAPAQPKSPQEETETMVPEPAELETVSEPDTNDLVMSEPPEQAETPQEALDSDTPLVIGDGLNQAAENEVPEVADTPETAEAKPDYSHIDLLEFPVIDVPTPPKPMEWTDRERKAIAFTEETTTKALFVLSETAGDPKEQRAQLVALLTESFDMDRVARILLGRHLAEVNDRQLTDYQSIVSDYLVNLYADQVLSVIRADQLTVDAHERRDRVFIVRTALPQELGVKPVLVDWRLCECEAGSLKFIDVSVDGVSLAVAKRNEFDAVITKKGFDAFLELLHEQAGLVLPTPLNTAMPPSTL